ncbi:MAG TPA: chitobiase/beta-hexosaminidase C-terminal domain-containing protein, partial [Verrucomicrobiae bacterium]|nr:chitobiase/beta-hexosaminidase C-terminal domain-containing protein [Verrucomicrobiae bacterium]
MTGLVPNQDYFIKIWSYDNSSTSARVSDWVESASGVTRVITNGYTFDGAILPAQDGQSTLGGTVRSSPSGVLLIEGRRAGGTSHGVFLNALELVQIGYGSLIASDVGLDMSNINASVYLRVPFNVADPAALETLKLRMKYDDGFVAYLNGQVVASRNAPASPAWNSTATAPHPNADAITFEEFSWLPPMGQLVTGQNVLAIHGLNVSANDSDFLILPDLAGYSTSESSGVYLKPPTPGAVNGTGYGGFVADTKFSVDRGFYDAPISVALTTATEGAAIRWTTNGSAPTESTGIPYSGPIAVAGTTLLRAAAFKAGLIPSDVDTHSYIYLSQVRNQPGTLPGFPTVWQGAYPADYGMDPALSVHAVYGPILSNALRSIPTLSIVSDHQGLWNASTGIYPNATSSGLAWERAASLELIEGSGQTEFAINCKIEMHGNASRDNARTPKHSMHATFNGDYGPTRLSYDWFRGPGATEHNKIVFRSCGFVDGWAGRYADASLYTSAETGESFRGLRYRPENTCYLRDSWVKDSFREMGWLSSRSEYVHLYLNGLYWGLYEPSEAIDASYFSETVGGLENSWDVIVGEDNNGPPVIVDGSLADWQDVLNRAAAGVTSEAAYQALAQRVDIDNLIDYMIVHIFAESEDWPRHNWYVAHRRATNGLPGTKFICTVWDQELTLDRLVRRNRVDVGTTGGEVYSPARVYAAMRSWPEFRRQFGDRVHQHLFNGGALTPNNNVTRLLASAAIIREAVVGESARWGDARKFTIGSNPGTGQTFTRDEWWQPEIDKLTTNFFQKLTADNVARFRTGLLYPTLNAPILSPFGGPVAAGSTVTLSNPNPAGVVYFTTDGSDPRTYGTAAVSPGAQANSGPIAVNATTQIRARTLNGGTWSALVSAVYYPPQDLSRLSLTEVMFNPPGLGLLDGDEFEFVELKNTGTNQLNLSGLTFSDGINFTFTNGTLLNPGAFFVLARNPAAFAQRYPGVAVHGVFAGRLDNGGERVSLSHPLGSGIFSVNYDDSVPWPLSADNHGFSMVQRNPTTQAPDDGAAWRASADAGGSPGADDPPPNIPGIVINEVLSASTAPDIDRIELFNPTSQSVGIGGWVLSDDPSIPFKFRIPAGT